MTNKKSFSDLFRAARIAGTPIIAVETADNAATVRRVAASLKDTTPLIQWDNVQGWTEVNKAGEKAIQLVYSQVNCDASATINAVESLILAKNLPGKNGAPGSVLFLHNAHEILSQPDFSQAIFNLRDSFKATQRTLVLLGPAFNLPAQLSQHVCILDEPLPTGSELDEIIKGLTDGASVEMSDDDMRRAREALLGLAAFPAESAVAMSIDAKNKALDFNSLWQRKEQMIAATPGLSVWKGGESFSDIGGCEQIKKFCKAILGGKRRPEAIVFIDEIEKAMAGAAGGGSDSSGVSQSMLGTMLSTMEDKRYTGMVFVGVPGAAKSAIAKAMGGEGQIPVISFDLSGMKDSLVGASEARLRTALKVVDAVSNGNALFIATSNNIQNLPPELLRRFTLGTWFFDLPTAEERPGIWAIYAEKYGLDASTAPLDMILTGAEIRNCVDIADRTGMALSEAVNFIVPVAKSGAEKILALRRQASGRYLSAAHPSWYVFDGNLTETASPATEAPATSRALATDV